ncbi:hypothetical protein J2S49_001035 [Arcanobacterium wilhelmae]|uniref:Uncharacterized protein n=1 Tax=Arcanobacterium wilhelmae TaxID=1803177 RepID=A0ABT9NB62_9ACTO|nr:hypothetical protein [Arcanobacterium wilhelmae]MDP9800959.1 hypothetical protein [Arcanobacterium wilhelmae]
MLATLAKRDLRPLRWVAPAVIALFVLGLGLYRLLNGSFGQSVSIVVGSETFGTLNAYPNEMPDPSLFPPGADLSDPTLAIPLVNIGGPWNLAAGMGYILFIVSLAFAAMVADRVNPRLGAGVPRREIAKAAATVAVALAAINTVLTFAFLQAGNALDPRAVLGATPWMYIYVPLVNLAFFAVTFALGVFYERYGLGKLLWTLFGLWFVSVARYSFGFSVVEYEWGRKLFDVGARLWRVAFSADPAIAMNQTAAFWVLVPAAIAWFIIRRMPTGRK